MNDIIIEKFDTWETSLFTTEFPQHALLQQPLLEIINQKTLQQRNAIDSQVAITAKKNLKESGLDFLNLDLPPIKELRTFIEAAISYAAFEANASYWPIDANFQADIIESWYHVTENGGYHDAHTHPNCSWCGIYFLEAGASNLDNQNGVNRFYEPRANACLYQDPGTAYLNEQGFWDIEPKNGQCILFPSYLTHSALPYFGDQSRIVIAFNCIIK